MLHGFPWVCTVCHCHLMITQKRPGIHIEEKSGMGLAPESMHSGSYRPSKNSNFRAFGLHGIHGPSSHYVGPHAYYHQMTTRTRLKGNGRVSQGFPKETNFQKIATEQPKKLAILGTTPLTSVRLCTEVKKTSNFG